MFRFINDRFGSFSLPVALVVLTFLCFVFALIASAAAFRLLNGTLPENLVAVVAVASVVASLPMILQSMPTIKRLQQSQERLRRTRDELSERVAELDATTRALDAARSDLEERVNRRTRELEEARTAAEEASRAKSTFLARMSHELRTPLNAVIGFSELLSHPDAFSPARRLAHVEDYAGTINRSGRHLLSLVNDLLDLSKIEAGQIDLVVERIDLAALIEDAEGLVRPQAAEKGQTLTCAIDADAGDLSADRRATMQVIVNLLGNAVKYSPPGSRVSLACEGAEGGIAFIVRDEGPGMTAAEIVRAMEPFGRLEGAERADEPGTGLGLPIVASLVEAQGGTFALESVPGAGTEARVTLPRAVAAHRSAVA